MASLFPRENAILIMGYSRNIKSSDAINVGLRRGGSEEWVK